MNILHYPSNPEGRKVKEKLKEIGIVFTTVYKESNSTVRLFTETDSLKGTKQIEEHIQSLK